MQLNFEELYNLYYMKVYSYILTLSKNPNDAEEITQRAFFKAMTAKGQYSGKSSEFTWLCAIAKNLFLDTMRANKRRGETGEEMASSFNIENALANEDMAFRVHQVVHNLEEPYKEVFQLRVFGELSFDKIGKLFTKTENWARVTYHRARLKIQERVES